MRLDKDSLSAFQSQRCFNCCTKHGASASNQNWGHVCWHIILHENLESPSPFCNAFFCFPRVSALSNKCCTNNFNGCETATMGKRSLWNLVPILLIHGLTFSPDIYNLTLVIAQVLRDNWLHVLTAKSLLIWPSTFPAVC